MPSVFDEYGERQARDFEERVVKQVLRMLKVEKLKYELLEYHDQFHGGKHLTLDILCRNFTDWFQGDVPVWLVAVRRFFLGEYGWQRFLKGAAPEGLAFELRRLESVPEPRALVFPVMHFPGDAACCHFGSPPSQRPKIPYVQLPTHEGPIIIEPLRNYLGRFEWPAPLPHARDHYGRAQNGVEA